MNKADIIRRLANTQLDDLERESLSQLLHYMTVEGVNTTSSNNTLEHTGSIKRSSKKSTSSSKSKRTSSKGKRSRG